jgi:tetratricopeptide (TPR) repeat protein
MFKATAPPAMLKVLCVLCFFTIQGNIGALLGMAISHKLSGSDIKAHNVLQNIVTMPFNFQFIREINNAYILLGNDYLHKGSVEMAHECCTKVLSQNKSLFYAWQLQGKVLEQRCSKLSEILECYEQCWDLTSNASCSAGYGAAALCLKMNNFSKALNIITKIYKLTPDNPHVKALIMKSASSLKP